MRSCARAWSAASIKRLRNGTGTPSRRDASGGAGTDGSYSALEVNSEVKLDDVLHGLVIQSGNDAAIALAEAGVNVVAIVALAALAQYFLVRQQPRVLAELRDELALAVLSQRHAAGKGSSRVTWRPTPRRAAGTAASSKRACTPVTHAAHAGGWSRL